MPSPPPLVSSVIRSAGCFADRASDLAFLIVLDLERGTRSLAASRSMVSDPTPSEFSRIRIWVVARFVAFRDRMTNSVPN